MTMTQTPPRVSPAIRSVDAVAPDESELDNTRDPRWHAVINRDKAWDGAFVFAVTSTRIYCKPSCPSRRPRADRVRFYEDGDAARHDGFRACKRCRPETASADATTVAVVRALIQLDARDEPVSLDALAASSGISRSHLQRQFTQLVGCSPHEWQSARRAERLRRALRAGESVSGAAFAAGFESLPSAYTTALQHLGMTPGAYKRGAAGETVYFTVVACALGHALVAMTTRGVCRVILDDDPAQLTQQLRNEMPAAELIADDSMVRDVAQAVVASASGVAETTPLPLDLRGTAFQQRVWRELTKIPRGETITYAELAKRVGSPGAVRAVGSACGANPAALIVPCHRVLRSDGALGGYRWGLERKARVLQAEQDG